MTEEEISTIQDNDNGRTDDAPGSFERKKRTPNVNNTLRALISGRENMAIGVMVIAAIAVIGFMAMKAKPQEASAEDIQAKLQEDATMSMLEMPTPVKDNKSDELIKSLYCDGSRRQIPMASLSGNPFIFDPPKSEEDDTNSKANGKNHKQSDDARLAQVMREARKLELVSVMVGPNGPVALISGERVAKGQKVAGWTVSEIHPLKVVLTWRDREYVLKIRE